MTTEISILDWRSVVVPMAPQLCRSLSRLRSASRAIKAAAATDPERLSRWPVGDRELPSPYEAAALEARHADLGRWLAPARQRALEPLLEVLAAMPSQSGTGVDHAMRVGLYVDDVGDMPLFAIERACDDFRKGRVGGGHWAPTAAEIRKRADHIAAPYRVEHAEIGEVLEFARDWQTPQNDGDAMRARVNKLFGDLCADLGRKDEEERAAVVERASIRLDELMAMKNQPIACSETLRALIERQNSRDSK